MIDQTILQGIKYNQNGSLLPLPEWGKFFIALGHNISQIVGSDARFIVALSIPSRTFCTAFISLGYIAHRITSASQTDYSSHANFLKSLPQKTPVILRIEVGKKFKGLLLGYCQRGDQKGFIIKTDKKNSTEYFIREEDSKKIETLNIQEEFKLPDSQKGRDISPRSQFSSILLGNSGADNLISSTVFEEVIIGPKSLLRNEITGEIFSTRNGVQGTLQEILRTKNFQNTTSAYRTIIVSDRIRFEPDHSRIQDPHLAVFDGTQGYLKWRNFWKKSNWIVVLDRTENQFEPAVEQLTKEFVQNRIDKHVEINIGHIPNGIEAMAFLVNS